jgi:hypothetical protein
MKHQTSIKPQNVIERDKKIAAANAALTLMLRKNSLEARALASYIEDFFEKHPDAVSFDFIWDALSSIEKRTGKKDQNGDFIGDKETSILPRGLRGRENCYTVKELSVDLAQKVLDKSFPHSNIYWSSDNVIEAGEINVRDIIENRMKLVIHARRRRPRAYIGAALNARPLKDEQNVLEEIADECFMSFAED